MTSRTRYLIDDLKKTHQSFYQSQTNPQQSLNQSFLLTHRSNSNNPKLSPSKLSKQKSLSKIKYEQLTNMTFQQQRQMIWKSMLINKKKKKDWNHTYYTGNNKIPNIQKTFSIIEKTKAVEQFPHNNAKYNVQFLEKSLYGTGLKFPRSESGQFKKPSNHLYSRHYRPIVKQKIKYNQDYQLRTSMFGKTWVDQKRDRIMNKYEIQTNPFKTPKSNQLISKMSKSQFY